jgi:hypothetical protein
MRDITVALDIVASEGLVGIRFGREMTYLTWIDAMEMATRLITASIAAAASIEVDPDILARTQISMFEKIKKEFE